MAEEDPTFVVTPKQHATECNDRWYPVIGTEAKNVVKDLLDDDSGNDVIEVAASILGRCSNPQELKSRKTGLVMGYVQSGKTLSFTTVIALARDNGYQMVIAIAGISTSLLQQSADRLNRHLSIDKPDGYLRWNVFKNPTNEENGRNIRLALEAWRDFQEPDEDKPTVLITVMKNHKHLSKLVELLRKLNLNGVPTLIVDDEADQASLNTSIKKARESTTYKQLLELRETIPHHTFLQYTATPQALLLVDMINSLSPNFVEVLEPGKDYVGGKAFFPVDNTHDKNIYVENIHRDETDIEDDIPPESLLIALRVFFVGVVIGTIQRKNTNYSNLYPVNRSMLVHPSRETAKHEDYQRWIKFIIEDWMKKIKMPDDDPDRLDFINDFLDAYNDISRTVQDLPTFSEVTSKLLKIFQKTHIEEINTRKKGNTPEIKWSSSYSWILIGGQAMDRGFTVEGLTVTYMPRGPGGKNADTIQQRGRFFGYKKPYLGFCRIFLKKDLEKEFESYVVHEEELRKQMKEITGPLNGWKRIFILKRDSRLCRDDVISKKYFQTTNSKKWFTPHFININEHNDIVVKNFLNELSLNPNKGHNDREKAQKHRVCYDRPLKYIVEKLLTEYKLSDLDDQKKLDSVLFQISYSLENNPDEKCAIYQISPNYPRRRTIEGDGKLKQLFQGEAPVYPKEHRGSVYPGDKKIYDRDNVTIQIHTLKLSRDGETIGENVPVIAIWIPERMGLPLAVQ